MAVRFYVDQFRNLMADMDGEREGMIITKGFMQNENIDKAADYLRGIAVQLTKLYNDGKIDKAAALMEEAESKVSAAKTAEKFLEEVSF